MISKRSGHETRSTAAASPREVTIRFYPGPRSGLPRDIAEVFRQEGLTPMTVDESGAWGGMGGGGGVPELHQFLTIGLDGMVAGIGIFLGSLLKGAGEDAWAGVKAAVQRISRRRRAGPGKRAIALTILIPLAVSRPGVLFVTLYLILDGDEAELEHALKAVDEVLVQSRPDFYSWDPDTHRWVRNRKPW